MHDYAGDILYTMFLFFLLRSIWLRTDAKILSLAAFVFSTVVEFTQLLNAPVLETIRSSFIGRTLIGNGFNLFDILYYFIGSLLGLVLMIAVEKKSQGTDRKPVATL